MCGVKARMHDQEKYTFCPLTSIIHGNGFMLDENSGFIQKSIYIYIYIECLFINFSSCRSTRTSDHQITYFIFFVNDDVTLSGIKHTQLDSSTHIHIQLYTLAHICQPFACDCLVVMMLNLFVIHYPGIPVEYNMPETGKKQAMLFHTTISNTVHTKQCCILIYIIFSGGTQCHWVEFWQVR